MRKLLPLLVLPALAFGTIAAAERDAPCPSDLAEPVLVPGDSLSEAPTGAESFSFYVDTSGTDDGRATVSAVLTWENALNDWDLDVQGSLSEGYQPFDPAQESAVASVRDMCRLVTVTVIDYLAPLPELGMDLQISVS